MSINLKESFFALAFAELHLRKNMVGTKPKEDENGEEGKREKEKTKGIKIQDSFSGIFVTLRLSNVESAKVGTHTRTRRERESMEDQKVCQAPKLRVRHSTSSRWLLAREGIMMCPL